MTTDLTEYKKRLREALDDKFLGKTLDTFARAYRVSRAKAFEGMDLQGMIKAVAKGKDASVARIDELFESFRAKAEAAGAKVHVARTAHDANRIMAEIATASGVRSIVKAKSMTAEETHLNPYLEAKGFEVTETDLGEWIIQLRGEGPSHMVMPAIHLSRGEVAELFTEVTGEKQDPEDINKLVKVARRELRRKFIEADMGVSGANFLIADTGTIGIMTNEGNGRLCTTMPRVHVVLAGFDKLVPDIASALRILEVLPRNATGQAISSYVTWITGAAPCAPGPDGKKEFHIIVLDNGRLALAKDPVFSEALRCVRCGACANVCPAYRMVGGHKLGHIYIGAIGMILTLFYHGVENAEAIVQNCMNCMACKDVCVGGIDLPALIKETYGLVKKETGTPFKDAMLATIMSNRRLFHTMLRSARLAQLSRSKHGPMMRHLPFFLSPEHQFRSLPRIADKPLRDIFDKAAERFLPRASRARAKVALFAGCAVDFIYPEQGVAMLKALEGKSIDVRFEQQQTCCGLPLMMMAEKNAAVAVAKQNIAAIDPGRYDYILTLCASCASFIKENYPRILAEETGLRIKARQFADKIIDFSTFMTRVAQISPVEFLDKKQKVAYHYPCHLVRGLHTTKEPKELLDTIGAQYTPSEEEDVCCGFGGSYSVNFPEISARILKTKLDNVEASGAEYLVTDCPGCVLQLRGGADKRGGKIKVMHMAELVAHSRKD